VTRRCARPGCPGAAEATLSYNYAERTVWVDDLTVEPHPMLHDLCAEHAARLGVPMGWTRRDRRSAPGYHQRLSA